MLTFSKPTAHLLSFPYTQGENMTAPFLFCSLKKQVDRKTEIGQKTDLLCSM